VLIFTEISNNFTWVGLLVSLTAGVVRGFAGFGFSALAVAGLSLFVAPASVVPAALVLEVLASVAVWRIAVRDFDRDWLKSLVIGNAICIPIGVFLLTHLDPMTLRLLVGLALLLTATGLRWRGVRPLGPGRHVQLFTGALSGFLNGLAASGGVAAALMMAGCHVPPLALRSTIIMFLIFGCSYTLIWASFFSRGGDTGVNLFNIDTLRWMLVLAPGMLTGMWLGNKAFAKSNPARFRQLVLDLLVLISSLAVVRAVIELAWS
jgi:uncharacterized membrane protein YfcA